MSDNRTWSDALTDGQIIRDWFSLISQFVLGMTYISFFIFAYSTSISLIFILIGIPLLLFTLASTRAVAAMDQRMFAAILDEPVREFADDVDTRGANFGQRLGMYLGSWTTWRSLIYLAVKFPVGMVAFTAALFILPFLGFEMLFLGPLGIDMRLATPRLLHAVAVGLHKFPGMLLPTESYERDEPQYYLDDDGEIAIRKRA